MRAISGKRILFELKSSRFGLIRLGLGLKAGYRHDGRNEYEDERIKRRHDNLYLYKSKGQHLLTNPRVLDVIIRKSVIRPSDTVLEIGPGTGNLTLRLLQVARKVVAVEIDKRMVEVLQRRVDEHGLQDKLIVIQEDALKAKFPHFDLVVANIPYGISSPLITKLVYGETPFRSATLLLQKEFAQRLLANPGDSEFNRLAVNVKLVSEVEFVMNVSKKDFLPPPKVDSSVIVIHPKSKIPQVNLDEWLAFTRVCFCKKNKTLGATFKQKKKVIELFRLSKMTSSSTKVVYNPPNYLLDEDDQRDDPDNNEDNAKEQEHCHSSSPSMDVEELCSFKEKILNVLKATGFEDKRPSKLSNQELINILSSLNQTGIYFYQSKTSD